mmetsp:Transcript_29052/g.63633  ORF Transcript_29052/g.63633 Transcript_29052/m.63633 type:complete len:267 (+) Transcript_29052:1953-2753(+)
MLFISRVMLALRPFGGSVVILMPRCKMPIGNLGWGEDESQSLKDGWGERVCSVSMSLSSSPSHDIIRWQLARRTQCPSLTPLSISRSACGAWPCPRAMVLKVTPWVSASWSSWFVGSTPGVNTKMSGEVAIESAKTELRSSTGGSVNLAPRLFTMNEVVAKTIRSGRRQRTMMSRCISEHRFSHSPGNRAAEVSGSAWRYHSRQSRADDSNDDMMFLKFGSLSSSLMWSHAVSEIQSAHGFAGCCDLSNTCPPRRKKSYSCWFIFL